jgi:hypothetical protein
VTCQITRLPGPHDRGVAPQPMGAKLHSSAQASGGRASEEGDMLLRVSNPFRLPSSEARRRIPASCPFLESRRRQSRATPASLAASDRRSEPASRLHRSPVKPWGGTTTLATVPTGLADSREPTRTPRSPGEGDGASRDRAGVLACLPNSSRLRLSLVWPRRTSCPSATCLQTVIRKHADQDHGLGLKSGLIAAGQLLPCSSPLARTGLGKGGEAI